MIPDQTEEVRYTARRGWEGKHRDETKKKVGEKDHHQKLF